MWPMHARTLQKQYTLPTFSRLGHNNCVSFMFRPQFEKDQIYANQHKLAFQQLFAACKHIMHSVNNFDYMKQQVLIRLLSLSIRAEQSLNYV